ncbi:hypothetical protein JOB18_038949 [Solea senegalensis]|uniref:Uncharacterized protein n=1 Tax=Solea senegalensis TaxID=28829 RepID=A0AAV6QRP0_SOLSE|nr:hypothetical protein JOB18_038949 [Solea senegalensis]
MRRRERGRERERKRERDWSVHEQLRFDQILIEREREEKVYFIWKRFLSQLHLCLLRIIFGSASAQPGEDTVRSKVEASSSSCETQ